MLAFVVVIMCTLYTCVLLLFYGFIGLVEWLFVVCGFCSGTVLVIVS